MNQSDMMCKALAFLTAVVAVVATVMNVVNDSDDKDYDFKKASALRSATLSVLGLSIASILCCCMGPELIKNKKVCSLVCLLVATGLLIASCFLIAHAVPHKHEKNIIPGVPTPGVPIPGVPTPVVPTHPGHKHPHKHEHHVPIIPGPILPPIPGPILPPHNANEAGNNEAGNNVEGFHGGRVSGHEAVNVLLFIAGGLGVSTFLACAMHCGKDLLKK